VTIEETVITRITGDADVELRDGRLLGFAGLFTATRTTPASPLAAAAGCALVETPMGSQIRTADSKETSVPGIFACGDVARAPHSVSLAVADGAWAGAQLHQSLVWPGGQLCSDHSRKGCLERIMALRMTRSWRPAAMRMVLGALPAARMRSRRVTRAGMRRVADRAAM
jgi:hypothetical protein